MLEIERGVEKVVVLPEITHRAFRLILDAVGHAFVAGGFGRLGRLEFGSRCPDGQDVAIDCLAKGARKNARRLADILCGGLCCGAAYECQSRDGDSEHPDSQSSSHCSCSL